MALLSPHPFPGVPLPQSDLTLFIHSNLLRIWRVDGERSASKTPSYNPAPNPISIRTEHLRMLKPSSYLVAEKTHGQRCLLFLTRGPQGQPLTLLIGRRMQIYSVQVAAHKLFYSGLGTLFDGEIVINKGRYYLVLFDTMCFQGSSLMDEPSYVRRMSYAQKIVPKTYPKTNKAAILMAGEMKLPIMHDPPVLMRAKPIFELSDLGKALAGSKEYPSDGLIFMPKFMSVQKETHRYMIKWKKVGDNTIDLRLVAEHPDKTSALLECRYLTQGKEVDIFKKDGFHFKGYTLKVMMETTKALNSILRKMKKAKETQTIVECMVRLDIETEELHLSVLAERQDKSYPNNMTTLHGTLETIQNNITEKTLVEHFAKLTSEEDSDE